MRELDELLKYLERNLDPEHIERTIELQKKCLNYEKADHLSVNVGYPREEFKPFPYSEVQESMEKMMYNELLGCLGSAEIKDNSIPMIRANYGVGILPSLFGLKCVIINNSMPWVEHAENEDQIKAIIDKGVPELGSGLGEKVSRTHEFYKEKLSQYPKCSKCIRVYHPDMQGPLDVAHLIWGSEIYMAVYDSPELVHSLLELVTQTYIKFMQKMKTEINDELGDYNAHWGQLFKGKITLRNDSAVNLSKDMYIEFAKDYDEKILEAFGSGSMHFCGRADQWVFDMAETKGICGMNFGYMSNVEFGEAFLNFIYDKFAQLRLPIMGYHLTAEEYKNFNAERFATGITLQTAVDSKEEAIELMRKIQVL